ncbi:MAG: DUF2634 domain-containing protein [Oscillospiraceae bacterium]
MATLPTTGDDLDLIAFSWWKRSPATPTSWTSSSNRVQGMTDEQDAVRQAVYLILNVERYAYPIYSRNYGSELTDLIGQAQGLRHERDQAAHHGGAAPGMTASPPWTAGRLKPAGIGCWPGLPSIPSYGEAGGHKGG